MSFIDTIMHLPEDIRNAFHSLEMRVETLEAASFDSDRVTPMETPIVDPSHVSVVPSTPIEVAPASVASKDAPEVTEAAPAPEEKK